MDEDQRLANLFDGAPPSAEEGLVVVEHPVTK
jgi:hypothetical protein